MAKTKCDKCPILYNDEVYDPTCNLGYKVYWSQMPDKGDEYYSDECGLEFVRFAGGEFRPTLRAVDPPSALVSGGNSENSAGN